MNVIIIVTVLFSIVIAITDAISAHKKRCEETKKKEKEAISKSGTSLSHIVSKVMIADGRVSDEGDAVG